jgi:hypothetical protein
LSRASDQLFLKKTYAEFSQNYYWVWELVHVYSHFLILLDIRTQLLHLPKVAMYILLIHEYVLQSYHASLLKKYSV